MHPPPPPRSSFAPVSVSLSSSYTMCKNWLSYRIGLFVNCKLCVSIILLISVMDTSVNKLEHFMLSSTVNDPNASYIDLKLYVLVPIL